MAEQAPDRRDGAQVDHGDHLDEGVISDAYRQVKARLGELVARLAAQGRFRLPAEEQLVTTLRVSRSTVRSALLSLQKEGKIQRLHGRGTFINKYALEIPANIVEDRPFLDLLSRLGYQATQRSLRLRAETLPPDVAAALEVSSPAAGCVIDRVFEADGTPAVFSVDFVPMELLAADVDKLDPGSSTFAFMAENTEHPVSYSVASLVPIVADSIVAERLGLGEGHPLLLLRHLHVDAEQQPVALTMAYVNDAFLRFSVVRTYRED